MTTREGTAQRGRRSPSLRVLYLVIGGAGLVAAVATVVYPDVGVVQEFGPNLATESLAIVVTLAVVRRILDRQERNRRLRASVGALRKAARSLRAMAQGWSQLVKGALARIPAERPTSYEELLASHYTEALTWLDPEESTSAGPAHAVDGPVPDSTPGVGDVARLLRRITDGRQSLAHLSQSYAVVLDGDYVEALEALVDDRFTTLLGDLVARGVDAVTLRRRLNLARGPRESCFRALLAAIRIHNQLAEEAATQRSEHLLPRADVLDIALSVEDDLMVDPTLESGFWGEPPLPGSLRAHDTGQSGSRHRGTGRG